MIGQLGQQSQAPETTVSSYMGRFSYWKAVSLGVLAAAGAFFSGFFIDVAMYTPGAMSTSNLIWLIASLVVFLVFYSLTVLLVDRRNVLAVLLIAMGVALGAGLFAHLDSTVLLSASASTLLIVWGGLSARTLFDDSLAVHFFRIADTALRKAVLALAIIAGAVFFTAFAGKPLGADNPFLSQNVFEGITNAASKALGPLAGEIDFSLSLRQMASRILDQQLATQPQAASAITPALRAQMVQKIIDDYESKLSGISGGTIDPDKTLSSALYDTLLDRLNGLSDQAKTIMFIVGATMILLTILSVAPFLRPVVGLIAWLLFEILVVTKFAATIYETKSKETIVLP